MTRNTEKKLGCIMFVAAIAIFLGSIAGAIGGRVPGILIGTSVFLGVMGICLAEG